MSDIDFSVANEDWTHVGVDAENDVTFYKYIECEGYCVQMLDDRRWRLMPDSIEMPGFIRSREDIEALTENPHAEMAAKLSVALRDERLAHAQASNELAEARQELEASRGRVLELIGQKEELVRRNRDMASEVNVADHSRRLHEEVIKGEREYHFECDQKGPYFIRPKVIYDVCTETETHVPDCLTLKEAQRYCKQLNIEDRMGDGRVDFGGETPNDLTGFVEANKQMIRNVLTLSDDVLAYLATLPDEENQ